MSLFRRPCRIPSFFRNQSPRSRAEIMEYLSLFQMNIDHIDKEFIILENIYNNNEKLRQRDLSQNTGISLGMTNMIVKRLVKKGMLVASKINSKNIHYAVTPDGINEIVHRSYRYFKRTMDSVVRYRSKIELLTKQIRKNGFSRVCLIGKSDLDFILEHFCALSKLKFIRKPDESKTDFTSRPGMFFVYSENTVPPIKDKAIHAISLYEWLNRESDE